MHPLFSRCRDFSSHFEHRVRDRERQRVGERYIEQVRRQNVRNDLHIYVEWGRGEQKLKLRLKTACAQIEMGRARYLCKLQSLISAFWKTRIQNRWLPFLGSTILRMGYQMYACSAHIYDTCAQRQLRHVLLLLPFAFILHFVMHFLLSSFSAQLLLLLPKTINLSEYNRNCTHITHTNLTISDATTTLFQYFTRNNKLFGRILSTFMFSQLLYTTIYIKVFE